MFGRQHKIMAFAAALPTLLIVAIPALTARRDVASVPQFRNWGLENKITNSHIHAIDAWKIEEGSRDIVVAALHGAEEVAFGTALLVALGCDMALISVATALVRRAPHSPAAY